jgi:hypothetical protein
MRCIPEHDSAFGIKKDRNVVIYEIKSLLVLMGFHLQSIE